MVMDQTHPYVVILPLVIRPASLLFLVSSRLHPYGSTWLVYASHCNAVNATVEFGSQVLTIRAMPAGKC